MKKLIQSLESVIEGDGLEEKKMYKDGCWAAGEYDDDDDDDDDDGDDDDDDDVEESYLGERLMRRQENMLEKYLASGGDAMSFDDLPEKVQGGLRKVKDQETLWSDVDRWLGDNNNPHLRRESGDEYWCEDTRAIIAGMLMETFGDDIFEGVVLMPSNIAKEFPGGDGSQKGQVGEFFVPPAVIDRIAGNTFPDAVKLWWGAVGKLLKRGKAFDLTDPDKIKPFYGKVYSIWKDSIEGKYGFRPSRTKEKSMEDGIEDYVKSVCRNMRKLRLGKQDAYFSDPDMMKKGKEALRAKNTAAQRKSRARKMYAPKRQVSEDSLEAELGRLMEQRQSLFGRG